MPGSSSPSARLSRRLDWGVEPNEIFYRRRRAAPGEICDLTESNPTKVGLFPGELRLDVDARAYDPSARGLSVAREAIGREWGVEPSRLILTASTSEAYAWLFKLLCDPGDSVLAPEPSYPLVEYLARLEGVGTRPYALLEDEGWRVGELQAGDGARAVVVVNPGSPTGTYLTDADWARIAARGLPVIVDEVFATERRSQPTGLTFRLGGLSKSAGLPQVKLAWIAVSGPGADQALQALELIADSYLSVSTPAMLAAPALLALGRGRAIDERLAANRAWLAGRVRGTPMSVVSGDAGWWATLRVPSHLDEESLVLGLLERGVLVHPGYFFDFAPGRSHLVVSLIVPPEILARGLDAIAAECAILGA